MTNDDSNYTSWRHISFFVCFDAVCSCYIFFDGDSITADLSKTSEFVRLVLVFHNTVYRDI